MIPQPRTRKIYAGMLGKPFVKPTSTPVKKNLEVVPTFEKLPMDEFVPIPQYQG
jgi:hypothetical protein